MNEARLARYVRLTFPEPGRVLLKIGPGDHSCEVWELSKEQLRDLTRDGVLELLR